jgi:alpha-L-arabinofuranosidase
MFFWCQFLLVLPLLLSAQAGGPSLEKDHAERTPDLYITVDAGQPGAVVNPDMYGIFFEEINHSGDGGLYAELIQNRGFEENRIPEGTILMGNYIVTPNGWIHPFDVSDPLPAWTLEETAGASGDLSAVEDQPLNDASPISMHLLIHDLAQGKVGAVNEGFWGIRLMEGALYDLTFHARCSPDFSGTVRVALESPFGEEYGAQEISGLTESWQKFQCTLVPNDSTAKARFAVYGLSTGSVWFDEFSLFPRATWNDRSNGMRPELAERLLDLQPGFVRFPGGAFVSGCTLANRYKWKETLGPIEARPGHWSVWGYHSTDGLGFHEYLELCEDLGCPAMYVTCCGISDPFRKPETAPLEELDLYIEEALDAIEYAIGPVTSPWGALRAANGHPDPFDMKYIQIGNEHWGPDYAKHYALFYDAIKQVWPEIQIIACSRVATAPLEIVDEHFYRWPEWFIRQARRYDHYDRAGPRIYVGEYAVIAPEMAGTLYSALAEAAFGVGMERNADLFIMSSYAPTFLNVNDPRWLPDLICFNSALNYCTPSYYVRQLFGMYRPDFILSSAISPFRATAGAAPGAGGFVLNTTFPFEEQDDFHLVAGCRTADNAILIKAVNVSDKPLIAAIEILNSGAKSFEGFLTVLTSGDARDTNSFAEPEKVAPVTEPYQTGSANFEHTFPASSLTVFELKEVTP